MNKKEKRQCIFIIFCICLLVSTILSYIYAKKQYHVTSAIVEELINEYPDSEQKVIEIIKNNYLDETNNEVLKTYGFSVVSFLKPYILIFSISIIMCILIFIILIIEIIKIIDGKNKKRIYEITRYLEQINLGNDVEVLSRKEDKFSILQDEIYKTVTEMKNEKNRAIKEKIEFADSLANIAHQIKTPITSISLMTQISNNENLKKQANRLDKLVDSLLLISKIDAGALKLKNEEINVYTLLELSIEALEELINKKGIAINLPNHKDVTFVGDLDWSTEAFINIVKNCIEHTNENGKLDFDYRMNPLYTEIIIKDNGNGFDKEDLKNIFKRFYRGKNSGEGIGIGLSIAKAIIEMQNGFITAENSPKGGAMFNIRFYCH